MTTLQNGTSKCCVPVSRLQATGMHQVTPSREWFTGGWFTLTAL
ncbi:hypothetical protein [Oscillatoria sp. FACHB-1407]|nr:hypothetical protein [Oscillatoria sp. FACHB-1407]